MMGLNRDAGWWNFFTFMFRENGNSIDGKEKKKRKPYKVVFLLMPLALPYN